MPTVEAEVSCPVHDSFRVRQVAGMFDVPLSERATVHFAADVPASDEAWRIGLIVGPSGSGKSTLARQAFGDAVATSCDWPTDRAVIDSFDHLPIGDATGLLTAVGFSSPPSWIKPYHVLSGGERFRCDLARALSIGAAPALSPPPNPQSPLVVFDEFTSVVDRQVARIASAAIAKAIHADRLRCRFVAVTCHYDVAEWLEPDWLVDMATGQCQRRRLRRPEIRLEIFRCHRDAWQLFKRHHYLNTELNPRARPFFALWNGVPVAFCATLPMIGRRGRWRITRLVTLPDYQGIGIGMSVAAAVARLHAEQGLRISMTASHPAVLGHCRRSPRWRLTRVFKHGAAAAGNRITAYRASTGRAVASFEYHHAT